MADNRLRINAGLPVQAAMRAGGNEYPSGRLNAIAERYLAIVEEQRPALARQEWLAIFDVLNGAALDNVRAESDSRGMPSWAGIAIEIADADRLHGLGGKWGIDAQALARRIAGMPETARIAVVETAERFWRLCHLRDGEALDLATSHPATWPEDRNFC